MGFVFEEEGSELLDEVEVEVLDSDFSCVIFLCEGSSCVEQEVFDV